MKIFIKLIFSALVLYPLLPASAQGDISEIKIRKNGDRVDVSLKIDLPNPDPKMRYEFTPRLTRDGRAAELSPISIAGKKRAVADRRKGKDTSSYIIVSRKASGPVAYDSSVQWEDWMDRLSLTVQTETEGCCNTTRSEHKDVVADKLIHYDIKPHFNFTKLEYELTELEKYDLDNPFLHPAEDIDKRYDILVNEREKGSSVLHFKVSSHIIDTEMPGNSEMMSAIVKAFDIIKSDPNAKLKKIMIAGYASPEGSLAFNTQLAQRRAESVQKFIMENMISPDPSIFELYNGREDWDRLREKVAASAMPEKDEIIAVIDSYTMEQEVRKTKLKQLHGGAPYRFMLENFYPDLRNAGYVQVYYEIDRKATVAAAVTDKDGRTTYVDPESPANIDVTNINKAIDLMVASDFDGALGILAKLTSDEKALNIIGVCHMMKGDYTTARSYFERAVAAGDGDAQKNLAEIDTFNQIY